MDDPGVGVDIREASAHYYALEDEPQQLQPCHDFDNVDACWN
jgi:hypothetical protein